MGGRHADAEAHQPRVLRGVELLVNAQPSEEEAEAPPDSSAARGGESGREMAEEIESSRRRSHLEEEMAMLDVGLHEDGADHGQKDFNATAFDMQVRVRVRVRVRLTLILTLTLTL